MNSRPAARAIPTQSVDAVPASRLASVLEIVWMLLLILPAATSLSASRDWDLNQNALFIVSCWVIVGSRVLFQRRAYFIATLPVAVLGVVCMGTDFLREVDALELLLQWRTFPGDEIASAVRPYLWLVALGVGMLCALCWACWRFTRSRPTGRALQLGVAAGTVALAAWAPGTTWLRSWPIDGLLVVATTTANSNVMTQYLFPASSMANPRDPKARWNASRIAGAPAAETVVLIIGETMREDYLKECHGPDRVRPVAAGALVACDVTSSSDSTSASVPLIVSREMPGHPVRVSSDATVAHALGEAGFDTYWFGAQGSLVVWPDAAHQEFPDRRGGDSELLLPPLASALARPAPLKGIVLHANNAHDPYCARFDPAHAPYPVTCQSIALVPTRSNLQQVRWNYANAVDASVGFINDVIAELDKHPEPAFLVFSPDHGENLLDDSRAHWGHAMRHPTTWDTHVPAIFWANEAWRSTHRAQWANLAAQVNAPLMHIDLVPTLLSAAGVRYDDPRPLRVDLLTQAVPPRKRVVQQALNATIPWDTLVDETRAAGPLAATH